MPRVIGIRLAIQTALESHRQARKLPVNGLINTYSSYSYSLLLCASRPALERRALGRLALAGCRDVSAASELLLELWDIGGTRGAKQLQKLSQDPSKVIANARFLGSVEIPMTATMATSRGQPCNFNILPPPYQSLSAGPVTHGASLPISMLFL